MEKNYNKIINRIDRHYLNNNVLLDLRLIDYEGYNFYIRIDYQKSSNTYKLSWYDLDFISFKSIKKYANTCILNLDTYNIINNIMNNQNIIKNEYCKDKKNSNVFLKLYLSKIYSISFSYYIPKEIEFLDEIFAIIFDNMPKKAESFLYELIAELNGTKNKYDYSRDIDFDLYKGNIDKLFPPLIPERGKEYFNNNKVIYLEKIDDIFYACVEGKQEYLVKVKYNEEEKKLKLFCSCPYELYCKHIYAVLIAIRKKYKNKFLKVVYKNEEENIIEIIGNSKYFLSIGIIKDHILLVNNNRIEAIPILDPDGKCYFRVLEDDDNKTLSTALKKYKNKE